MVAAVPTWREPLLGPAAQRLEVGLLGARTAAVLRRVAGHDDVDDADQAVLRDAHRMIDTAATAVDVVESGGRLSRDPSSFGFGAMAFAVELTASSAPADNLPVYLRAIATDLLRVSENSDAEAAERLIPLFSTLADVATRQAGSVGEGGGSLI